MTRILFAEDVEDIALLMVEIMEHEGFEVTWVKDGEAAINELNTNISNYDILLTDVLMPNKDGFDIVNHVKENDLPIPIIVISGGGITISAADTLQAIEDNVDCVLRKPVNIEELKEAVSKLI